jgi:hypothetical protein
MNFLSPDDGIDGTPTSVRMPSMVFDNIKIDAFSGSLGSSGSNYRNIEEMSQGELNLISLFDVQPVTQW